MEIKHIKLLLTPCSNASQAEINILCLSFHWKRGEEEENSYHACVTDSQVFILSSTAG